MLLSFSPDREDSSSPIVSPPLLMAFANFLANALSENPKEKMKKKKVAEKKKSLTMAEVACRGHRGM